MGDDLMLQPISKFFKSLKFNYLSIIPYRIVRDTPVFYYVWKCKERNV